MPLEERKKLGEEAKVQGNTAYAAGDFQKAIVDFTTAINYEPESYVYYSNRSAAYLSAGQASKAMNDANKCIELNSSWAKGYARLGASYYFIKNYSKAVSSYATGLTMEPGNKQLQAGLTQAQAALQVQEEEVAMALFPRAPMWF